MNFWDTSLSAASPGTATPPPQAAEQSSPTLNEEVTEVIGQLGRFWGGFRKQVRHRNTLSTIHWAIALIFCPFCSPKEPERYRGGAQGPGTVCLAGTEGN